MLELIIFLYTFFLFILNIRILVEAHLSEHIWHWCIHLSRRFGWKLLVACEYYEVKPCIPINTDWSGWNEGVLPHDERYSLHRSTVKMKPMVFGPYVYLSWTSTCTNIRKRAIIFVWLYLGVTIGNVQQFGQTGDTYCHFTNAMVRQEPNWHQGHLF